jgi:hypothetical protein
VCDDAVALEVEPTGVRPTLVREAVRVLARAELGRIVPSARHVRIESTRPLRATNGWRIDIRTPVGPNARNSAR